MTSAAAYEQLPVESRQQGKQNNVCWHCRRTSCVVLPWTGFCPVFSDNPCVPCLLKGLSVIFYFSYYSAISHKMSPGDPRKFMFEKLQNGVKKLTRTQTFILLGMKNWIQSNWPILAQCSISIPPEKVRKPEHWAKMSK